VLYTIARNKEKEHEMENPKITIEISDRTASEWGYGKYINGIIDNLIWAWECLPKDASDQEIKAAIKRVRSKALYHYNKEFN